MKYEIRVLRVFLMDIFGSNGAEKNIFLLRSGDGEENGGLWAAKVLHLFRIGVGGSNESEEYVFFQYTDVRCLMDNEDKTLWCVCLW